MVGEQHTLDELGLSGDGDTERPQFPRGAVAAVEGDYNGHDVFVDAVQPDWVLLKLHHARAIYNAGAGSGRGGTTADEWAPDETNVITTSTIQDDKLDGYSINRERRLIEAFEPAAHVAADVSVYDAFSASRRAELIQEYMSNVIWFDRELDADTLVIPQLKGFTNPERQICYEGFDYFSHDFVAYYIGQLFTSSSPNRFESVKEDIHHAHANADIELMMIGLLGPEFLSELPDSVVAGTGMHAWRSRLDLPADSATKCRRVWEEISADVEDALF